MIHMIESAAFLIKELSNTQLIYMKNLSHSIRTQGTVRCTGGNGFVLSPIGGIFKVGDTIGV
jgi:hypothetical protein